MLCYVTPKEHLGLPDAEDVKQGLIAYRIAAHAADLARGNQRAAAWDRELSEPASPSTGGASSSCRSTPRQLGRCTTRRSPTTTSRRAEFCSMCGPKYCPMHNFRDIDWDGVRTAVAERKSAPRPSGTREAGESVAHRREGWTLLSAKRCDVRLNDGGLRRLRSESNATKSRGHRPRPCTVAPDRPPDRGSLKAHCWCAQVEEGGRSSPSTSGGGFGTGGRFAGLCCPVPRKGSSRSKGRGKTTVVF